MFELVEGCIDVRDFDYAVQFYDVSTVNLNPEISISAFRPL